MTTKSENVNLEPENPLDAFLMEAQTAPPHVASIAGGTDAAIRASAGAAATGVTIIDTLRAVPAEIAAPGDTRLVAHLSKEASDTRRRIADLRRVIDETAATQSGELRRLRRLLTLALLGLFVLALAELGVAIWMKRG
jgi:hypothetical protein